MKRVLLVEDDDAYAGLVDEAVRRYGMALRLERVASAETAWDFLRRRALNRRDGLPVCILLDMVTPGQDGVWLLEQMSHRAALRDIPVLVLSQRADAVEQARRFSNVVGATAKPALEADRRRLVETLLRLAGGMAVSA